MIRQDQPISHCLFVDLETGGTNPTSHSILTMGVTAWEWGKSSSEWDRHHWIVDDGPLLRVEVSALRYNKMSLPLSGVSVCLTRIWEMLSDWWRGPRRLATTAPILRCGGWNVGFDVAFLDHRMPTSQRPWNHRWVDVQSLVNARLQHPMSLEEVWSMQAISSAICISADKKAEWDAWRTAAIFDAYIRGELRIDGGINPNLGALAWDGLK